MSGNRGGARPGAGRKPGKVSAAKKAISEAAREHAEAALNVLIEVAKDTGAPASARVSAANAILDRGYGKPAPMEEPQPVDRLTQLIMEINRRGSTAPIASASKSAV